MQYKYELYIEFKYNSPIKGSLNCLTTIKSNNPNCKKYENIIPIIYIPQYADYLNGFISSKILYKNIGFKVNLYSNEMIIFADDISIHTNLSEL